MITARLDLFLGEHRGPYRPGDTLEFRYELHAADADWVLSAVEASVLWRTEGKGDEDFGVHLFERRPADTRDPLGSSNRFAVKLPASPLTYDGRILKIRWCVRARAFPKKGAPLSAEQPFRLVQRVRR